MVKQVYKINCWWEDDVDDMCVRFVAASSEEEANKKMKQYARELMRQGFLKLHWYTGGYQIEMDYVID